MAEEPGKKQGKAGESRRSFLNRLWLALGLVVLAEFTYLVVSFLRPRNPQTRRGDFGTVVVAGSAGDFALDTVTAFPRGQFYLARLGDGGFLAISRQCTHLGCTVPWLEEEKRFSCPCHASTFDITGNVIHAPAPRALDLFRVVIENNVVKVDTGRRIKRSAFQASQVTHPRGA
jgi:cytochrome b6-f complex iron-sulfur subunit